MQNTPVERQDMVDIFLDTGVLEGGSPSTVVDVSNDEIKIVRQGDIKIEL